MFSFFFKPHTFSYFAFFSAVFFVLSSFLSVHIVFITAPPPSP